MVSGPRKTRAHLETIHQSKKQVSTVQSRPGPKEQSTCLFSERLSFLLNDQVVLFPKVQVSF
jgi:hypothetical protein